MKEERILEAALFSAGRPLDLEEIKKLTGLLPEKIEDYLKKLAEEYEERKSSLEIARIGKKWAMQIRAEYSTEAAKFAPGEVPPDLLKTVALIAYHQPIRQSNLSAIVGGKAYGHVKALKEMNLITTKPKGRTLEIWTSKQFPEYFGINARKREDIKKFLAERVGLKQ